MKFDVGDRVRVVRGNGRYLVQGSTVAVEKVIEDGVDKYGRCRGYCVSNAHGGRSKPYCFDEDRFAPELAMPGTHLTVREGNGKYLRDGDTVKVLITVHKGVDQYGPITDGYITTSAHGKAKPHIWDADRFEA